MPLRMPHRCTRRHVLTRGAAAVTAVAASPLLTSCQQQQGEDLTTLLAPAARPDAGAPSARALTLPPSVAGVAFPDTALAEAAFQLAGAESPPELFNHVMRTYVFGALAMQARGVTFDEELAFLGAVLHDLGLTERFTSAEQTFELDGADNAKAFLLEHNAPPDRAEVIWDAIAMHTTGWLAARKRPEVAIVSQGALLDVAGVGLEALDAAIVEEILEAFPRLAFKRSIVNTMIEHCKRKPQAVLLTQFAETGRRHLPSFNPPILEDLVLAAPFES
ncbi:MAG: HD domain-containing protein [Myxococcales bacterium]|nr:HD domain-containing protein [Myxococcales bacterium]MDD9966318.1 HD domain-containing protein [Myxococcales bacterium]